MASRTLSVRERDFDLSVLRSQLPVKPRGASFPFADVKLGEQALKLRVPSGDDQEHIVELDRDRAKSALLERCIEEVPEGVSRSNLLFRLSATDVEVIEAALDDAAPDVGTTMDVVCPECGERQLARFDPYDLGFLESDTLFEEVHLLALHYHWGESEIFGLPRERRKFYLRMVEKSFGLHS